MSDILQCNHLITTVTIIDIDFTYLFMPYPSGVQATQLHPGLSSAVPPSFSSYT